MRQFVTIIMRDSAVIVPETVHWGRIYWFSWFSCISGRRTDVWFHTKISDFLPVPGVELRVPSLKSTSCAWLGPYHVRVIHSSTRVLLIPWTLRECLFIFPEKEVAYVQLSHLYGRNFLWTAITWLVRWLKLETATSHSLHLKGLKFSWTDTLCLLSALFFEKV